MAISSRFRISSGNYQNSPRGIRTPGLQLKGRVAAGEPTCRSRASNTRRRRTTRFGARLIGWGARARTRVTKAKRGRVIFPRVPSRGDVTGARVSLCRAARRAHRFIGVAHIHACIVPPPAPRSSSRASQDPQHVPDQVQRPGHEHVHPPPASQRPFLPRAPPDLLHRLTQPRNNRRRGRGRRRVYRRPRQLCTDPRSLLSLIHI